MDINNLASNGALDQLIAANPEYGQTIRSFLSMPGVVMAANALLADTLVTISLPSQGLPVETIAQAFDAQFAAIPGIGSPAPTSAPYDLAAGDAVHWTISLSFNQPDSSATVGVYESVYLVVSSTTAVIVEFVTPDGGVIPDEATIVDSFRFRP